MAVLSRDGPGVYSGSQSPTPTPHGLDRYAAQNENAVLVVARVRQGRLAVLGARRAKEILATSQRAVPHLDIKGGAPWLVSRHMPRLDSAARGAYADVQTVPGELSH